MAVAMIFHEALGGLALAAHDRCNGSVVIGGHGALRDPAFCPCRRPVRLAER